MASNKRTLKEILAEPTNNFYRKRHNKKSLTRKLGIHLGQCKCSAEIFQAETCSRSCEDRTELVNLFDRSTNQPLFFRCVNCFVNFSTGKLISLVNHLFNHVTFLQGCTAASRRANFNFGKFCCLLIMSQFVRYFASFVE